MPAEMVRMPHLDIRAPSTARTDSPPGRVRQRWLDNEGRLIATGGRERDLWWMHWCGLATFWFGDAGPVRAEPVRAGLDSQLRDILVRGVAPVVLLARGFEALHASAILDAAGVVGLCGRSGTGKSTLALALASTGVRHFADDTVMYRLLDDSPFAFSLPFAVRVDESARQAAGTGSTPQGISRSCSAKFRCVYHLVRDDTVDPDSPRFNPVPPTKRFKLLLSHAHPFEMGSNDRRRAFLQHLLTLARTVDMWECRFAPALDALPSLAASIRAHASRQ